MTVVREIDAHEALGPQGVHVATLIDRARRLTRGEIDDLYAARHAASDAARHAASDAALGATWGAARDATWDAALGAARDATLGAARGAARDAASGAAWGAARYAARYAARDTAEALLVRDRISKEDYDALTLPWRSAIGRIHPDDAEVRA